MNFVPMLQAPHNVADFAYLHYLRMSITILDINMCLRFGSLGCVVIVVRHITGSGFDEIVIRIKTGSSNCFSGRREKLLFLYGRHIQIDRFEEPALDEAFTKIAQYCI